MNFKLVHAFTECPFTVPVLIRNGNKDVTYVLNKHDFFFFFYPVISFFINGFIVEIFGHAVLCYERVMVMVVLQTYEETPSICIHINNFNKGTNHTKIHRHKVSDKRNWFIFWSIYSQQHNPILLRTASNVRFGYLLNKDALQFDRTSWQGVVYFLHRDVV